ncbi:MAG: hypothetical protein ACKV2U_01865 [Bryobacteraceae bacterium]
MIARVDTGGFGSARQSPHNAIVAGGADVNSADNGGNSPLLWCPDFNAVAEDGRTALLEAALFARSRAAHVSRAAGAKADASALRRAGHLLRKTGGGADGRVGQRYICDWVGVAGDAGGGRVGAVCGGFPIDHERWISYVATDAAVGVLR